MTTYCMQDSELSMLYVSYILLIMTQQGGHYCPYLTEEEAEEVR